MTTETVTEVEVEPETVAVTTTADEPEHARVDLDQAAEECRQKINDILSVTPYITRAMVQVALSPALPPKFWDPILTSMVESKQVLSVEAQVTSNKGRTSNKTIYFLPIFPYPPIQLKELRALANS
jgi:hypothetical protein